MEDKAKKNCGIALLAIGGISVVIGFILYVSGDPESAGEFFGAIEKARQPKTRVTRRRRDIFGSYTETVYV